VFAVAIDKRIGRVIGYYYCIQFGRMPFPVEYTNIADCSSYIRLEYIWKGIIYRLVEHANTYGIPSLINRGYNTICVLTNNVRIYNKVQNDFKLGLVRSCIEVKQAFALNGEWLDF
jgi:hypothetical protein